MATLSIYAFLICAGLIFYVIAGYPLVLGWLARRNGRRPAKQNQLKSVSILIAVYNGEAFLRDKLQSVMGLDYPRELLEIFVLSDGSTDDTAAIAREFADQGVQLFELPKGGKPVALNFGIQKAIGEILVLTDVRQVLEPASIREMVSCFADPTIGVVSGDLPFRKARDSEESNTSLYWRYERWMRKRLGELGSTFGATGPFYGMRRSLARQMPPETLLDDMYLPLGAFFEGYRVIVDEQARAIDYPLSIQGEFRRKVRTLAGNYQIMQQFPRLLTLRNPMLFHFLSYKLGRLLLPVFFVVMFVASFGLPWPVRLWALIPQLLFYALAILDLWVPSQSAIRRASGPARTVVSMLAAAACAVSVFFVPPHKLWTVTQARPAAAGSKSRVDSK